MNSRQVLIVVGLVGLGLWCGTERAVGQQISHGRQVILNRGLQLQSLVWPTYGGYTGITNLNQWSQANFTGLNFFEAPFGSYESLLSQMPAGTQWGRDTHNNDTLNLDSADAAYANSFVGFCYEDETSQTQAVLDAEKSDYAAWKAAYPNALAYTNFGASQMNASQLSAYMQYTQPDMIMFDNYPSFSFSNSARNSWYSDMQEYRLAGLAGNDGTGASPIPYAQYVNLYRSSNSAMTPSESYVRLQEFASWAFGYTFTSAFVYDNWWNNTTINSAMFDSAGDIKPNAVFNYVAETNRESRNLGPALVRMVSTGIFMKPGSGKSVSGTGLTAWSREPAPQPATQTT